MRIRHTPYIMTEEEKFKIANAILNSKEYMGTKHGDFLRIR